jgi:APA family basic amino acid/polyamine antiporter
MPGHPVSTALFAGICWWVVGNTIYRYPKNSLIGFAMLLAGVPVYWFWSRRQASARSADS